MADPASAPDAPVAAGDPAILIEAEDIRAHMTFLADDLLEGREAGTRGEALAALYLRARFAEIGLTPAGDNGTFVQTIPVRSYGLVPDSVRFEVTGPEGAVQTFGNGGDLAVFGDPINPFTEEQVELVFAGSGIVAPELGLDAYGGLDVRGKAVVVLGGPPSYLPAAEAAHYSSTGRLARMAAERGAAGLIVLWTPVLEARWAFDRFETILHAGDIAWVGPDGESSAGAGGVKIRAFVRDAAADALFAGAPRGYGELLETWTTEEPRGFPLTSTLRFARRSAHEDGGSAMNVAGFLPGSDPQLTDEVVVVTAHYDHVGIGTPVDGDSIYNGAGDNAFGTAGLLEAAEAIASMEKRPKRPVLFLAVGAEEKGLIGSDYFAEFPTLPKEHLIANINIDGALLRYDFSDVIAFGAELSQMREHLVEAAGQLGLSVADDPFPEQSIFTRSDQYSFIRRGVPGVFLFTGFTSIDGEAVGRQVWDEITTTLLHQPNDDLSQPIDYASGAKLIDVARRLILVTANADAPPLFYDDSGIARRFAPDSPKAPRPDAP